MNKHFKLFVSLALTFGVAMGLVSATHSSLAIAVLSGAIEGLLFGCAMTLFLWGVNRLRSKRGISVDVPVRAARLVRIEATGAEVRQACMSALQALPKAAQVTAVDADSWKTQLGMSWWTFGDIVSTRVTTESHGVVQLVVTSVPKVKTTTVDYGKNAQNLDQLISKLNERFPGKVHAEPVTTADR
jgi:hypothetical protein